MPGKGNISGNGHEERESNLKNAMEKTQQTMATDDMGTRYITVRVLVWITGRKGNSLAEHLGRGADFGGQRMSSLWNLMK